MNNGMWDSECSSGCESGWTVYLEQSCLSPYPSNISRGKQLQLDDHHHHGEYEEEDEDMSMVSDASSGPPHFQQEPVDCKTIKGKKKKNKEKFRPTPDLHLDDTASSPVFFHFSQNNSTMIHNNQAVENNNNNNNDFSQGYSATHFQVQGRSSSKAEQQLGYYQYHLPNGNQIQMQQNQWYGS
ncbi:protein SOB FIVE-LIKE 5-like [Impatiens glandulifera]|uniref:protein SOB FIVE-LIKE 5-like n=1 Tax=Impatiens glandulifera TaxID=253017 RepID=UPI001FB18508|nr:protein SOB FIVE-LIKE 5-like [Impatiens glandulifera]